VRTTFPHAGQIRFARLKYIISTARGRPPSASTNRPVTMPYPQAGMTTRQAVIHSSQRTHLPSGLPGFSFMLASIRHKKPLQSFSCARRGRIRACESTLRPPCSCYLLAFWPTSVAIIGWSNQCQSPAEPWSCGPATTLEVTEIGSFSPSRFLPRCTGLTGSCAPARGNRKQIEKLFQSASLPGEPDVAGRR
jgi:hypothetical protein